VNKMNKKNYVLKCIALSVLMLASVLFGGTYTSADKPPPETSFVISIVDETNSEFVKTPSYITFTVEGGGITSTYNFDITESPQEIPYLPPSNVTITITAHAEGYKESTPYTYVVPSNPPTTGILFTHTFYLDKLPTTSVNIMVKDGKNDTISDAMVEISAVFGNENYSGYTDKTGFFTFSAQFIDYHITVSKEGYYTEERDITVNHNLSRMDFNITLYEIPPQYTRAVYLTIKDVNNNPIEGAEVKIHSPEIDVVNTTDENGSVVFELPSNDYTVTISARGYETSEYPMWVSNEPTALEDYFILNKAKFSILGYWYIWIIATVVIAIVVVVLMKRK